jgi:adenylate cyclase
MPVARSPEIESVVRRTMTEYSGDFGTLRNLMSADPSLRVLGFDRDEWWSGPDEFSGIRGTQVGEEPDIEYRIDEVEGFEDGGFGWATLFVTLTTPEISTQVRHTVLLRLESGIWKVIQLHNSIPVSNEQIFGVDLTKSLDDLVTSILDDRTPLLGAEATEGTMTLVFTDIVDSTPLAESVRDDKWAVMIRDHEAVIDAATASNGGRVVKFLGAGSMLAFESARAALRSAIEIQRETVDRPSSVPVGIHTGEVKRTADDLFGLTVNKAARIAAATEAGGITISSTTKDLVGSIDGVTMGDPRTVALKGIAGTHQIVPIEWA